MSRGSFNPALHRFALFTAAATFVLLGFGGLVTSHGAGMAVPDWPNTYGYNMFFFPISDWVGGIFYEHTHRLVASGVGMLTTILALWLYGRSARPLLRWGGLVLLLAALLTWLKVPAHWSDAIVLGATGFVASAASWFWPLCEPSPAWLRRCGIAAFVAVTLQGVLGGLRVVLFKDQIGIFHATLAQLFFAFTCALALFTSRWWNQLDVERALASVHRQVGSRLQLLLLGTTTLILLQLLLGATMRHQHAGLSIPDFPLAYGKIWPSIAPASVAEYNARRIEVTAANPITATQIVLQMVHRLVALLILLSVGLCAWWTRRRLGPKQPVSRLALAWFGLIAVQVLLGAATIWSNKAADIATAHVLVGALSLALGGLLNLVAAHQLGWTLRPVAVPTPSPQTAPLAGIHTRPASAAGLK